MREITIQQQGDVTYIQPMTRSEAERCIRDIRTGISQAREFYEREGWKALGYTSLQKCLEAEFGYSQGHSYRVAKAMLVQDAVQGLLPLGESVTIPERHARELVKLETPQQQAEAYTLAGEIARSQDEDVATIHVRQAVEQVQAKAAVFQSRYAVVSNMVATGQITARDGTALNAALDGLKEPRRRGHIVQLIGRFGLCNPDLVLPIALMFDRPPGKESYVLPEVECGYLASVPLAKATVRDLERANEEARLRHLAEAEEARRLVELVAGVITPRPISLTLYEGDWRKSVAVLRKVFGDGGFEALMRAGMEV